MNENNISIDEMFAYLYKTCEEHPECKGCIFTGGKKIQTDISILQCITGLNNFSNEDKHEQGTGSENNREDQARNDESKK